jgi:LacI family transcriptional regulator
MQALLALDPQPDAVFCFNDPVAVGALKATLAAGLRVPQDVALVGVSNFPYDELLTVPLTSVDQNSDAIGERAADLAQALLRSPPPRRKTFLLEPKLMVRASSQAQS